MTINGYTQPWASPNTNTDLAQGTNDRDTGPNTLQNFPTIQFFSSQTKDTSGFGEGETFLRSKAVTTNDRGRATFSVRTSVLTGKVVTATATNASGNTSEFSRGFEVP